MKDKILQVLVDHQEDYVSGEELSKSLGISRAGIWKHIEALRWEGYNIESQTRRGHKLIDGPLNRFVLGKGLTTHNIGTKFVVQRQVDSTNKLAKELARAGAEHGTVVIAEMQQGGKGRLGRSWVSPQGGIWMSIILRPQMELKDAACYTLLAGVAVARGLNDTCGIQVGIKWPNDLLLKGKKVAGILTEVQGEWQAVDYMVIGIGINFNVHAEDLPVDLHATSVLVEQGRKSSPVTAIQSILTHLERLEGLMLSQGPEAVLNEWRELAVCLHCQVTVKDHEGEWLGESVDIAADGSLLVRRPDGRLQQIYSADVSLRSKQGDYYFA